MRLVEGLRILAGSVDVLLCDVFGTIHDARGAFPEAIDALLRFRATGGFVLLLSNSAAPGEALARSLVARGVPDSCYDAVLTSVDVARGMLAERTIRSVHHIGADDERSAFAGLPIRLCSVVEAEVVVCTGCPEGPLPEATLAEAASRRLDLLCTNPDVEFVADCRILRFAGMIANLYAAMGGTVVATGKPGAAIYRQAIARVAAMTGAAPHPNRVLAVGDTLHLDVAGALASGYRALWIGLPAPDARSPGTPASPEASRLHALAW